MLRINEVLQMNSTLYRILKILPDEVVWINISDEAAFPSVILKRELTDLIDNEELSIANDPYAKLALLTPENGGVEQEKRDVNYQLVKPLIESQNYHLPKERSAVINQIIKSNGSTKQTLYRLARRYWQRGQIPNALIPDYKNSGAKGKKRKATTKLGRPREHMPGVGAIVNSEAERLFRIAIERYLLKENGSSFTYAYRRFQAIYETYFPNTSESEIPTKWQMMHFWKREFSQVEKIQKQKNKIEYKKDLRPITSTANMHALGPGSRYEIDATIADIYLVSDGERRNIVGRPVIYMVIDVFSRLVVGFYIGFENASYIAAMQALVMAMTSKVDYCKDYGFDILDDEWPAIGLPDAILADRGELLGHQIEALESSFSVRIENTPPFRGDAKGIVERSFRTIQAEFKPFAPGVVTGTKVKKRGGKDYRLDAKLTIHDFKEIILSSILVHNQYDILEKYDRAIDMPSDLQITPLSLWNWGLQNRTGRLRSASEDALRVSLLPRVKATISDLGVSAFGLYYTSAEIVQKGWLHRSKEVNRPTFFEVAYDPSSADNIYLFTQKNKTEYWICNLSDRSREFKGCSFWDVWQVQNEQKKAVAKGRLLQDKKKREHETFVEEKIKQAVELAPKKEKISNAKRISAIAKNKQKAKDEERGNSAYRPEQKNNNKPAEVIQIKNSQPDDCSFPDHLDVLFDDEDE